MDNLQHNETWQIAILSTLEKTKISLKELGIPVIMGSISGNGCCLISIESAELSDYRHLFSQGSICVITMEEFSGLENTQEKKIYSGIKIYVRLGSSNAWIYFEWNIPDIDCGEELFDEEAGFENELGKEDLISISLQVAQTRGFGILKNKSQRLEFTQAILPKLHPEAISNYTVMEIVSRSENYYELGVLPNQVRSMSNEGKTVASIAKELGISKPRAEKALACEIPEFISNLMK